MTWVPCNCVGENRIAELKRAQLQPSRLVRVSLVARSNYAAIAAHGVVLHTRAFGDFHFRPEHVFPSVEAAAVGGRVWHYVVIATKALPDQSNEPSLISPLVGPDTCIVLIQNGVGIEHPFRARFPLAPIVSAVTVISAQQEAPGVIRQHRWTRTSLGPYVHGGSSTNRNCNDATDQALNHRATVASAELCRLLGQEHGGIKDMEQYNESDLQVIRWHKLCINAAMNPSAILSGGLGNADMVLDNELREHLLGVMNEIWNTIPLVLGRPILAGLATPDEIIESTSRNHGAKPSMLLDWEAVRPLELEVVLGNPLRIAKQHGVVMPRTQTLYALLRSAQMQRKRNLKIGASL